MSLEQKVGQLLMIGVDGQQASCTLIHRFLPGAIVYRSGNVISPAQLRVLSAGLQDCAQAASLAPLWLALDHEGQYVNRFLNSAAVFPTQMAQGATLDYSYAYRVALAGGQELAYSGVNMVLGPVADVLTDYDNSVISLRSFGGDPQQVSAFVAQAVRGYLQAGVAPVLKHFPGHGGVAGDTHETLAVDASDRTRLQAIYLPPFQAGVQAGATAVMFSHVAFPNVESLTLPSSTSPVMVNLLRQDLGFQGFILTDSMGMGAIKNTYGDAGVACVKAIASGVDMVMTTSSTTSQAAYNSLLQAVRNGQLPRPRLDEAVRHILTAKAAWGLKSFPLAQAPAPDWQADQAVAFDVGYHAVAKVKDDLKLVPLPAGSKRILVIGPQDGWNLYPRLLPALREIGYTPELVEFSGPWNGPVPETDYLQSLPQKAARFDFLLVLTWEAHLNRLKYNDAWQVNLVQSMVASGKPLIVTALKSPTDLLEFPGVTTFIATFGTTDGQIQGLVDALVGKFHPTGVNPLPGLK